MHFMIIGALLHATILGVIAFFILFAASKADGFVALLGRVLGYWLLLLAALGLIVGIGSGLTGKPMMGLMGDRPWMMHRHWDHRGPPPPDAEPNSPEEKAKPESAPAKPG